MWYRDKNKKSGIKSTIFIFLGFYFLYNKDDFNKFIPHRC